LLYQGIYIKTKEKNTQTCKLTTNSKPISNFRERKCYRKSYLILVLLQLKRKMRKKWKIFDMVSYNSMISVNSFYKKMPLPRSRMMSLSKMYKVSHLVRFKPIEPTISDIILHDLIQIMLWEKHKNTEWMHLRQNEWQLN
jgi:hypothetical protein